VAVNQDNKEGDGKADEKKTDNKDEKKKEEQVSGEFSSLKQHDIIKEKKLGEATRLFERKDCAMLVSPFL
jgi:hypothetical protein